MYILGHDESHKQAGTPCWTKDEEAQLIDLRSKGMSSREIAIEIGKTRMAILGKLNRMKLNIASDKGRRTLKKKLSFKYDTMPDLGRCCWPLEKGAWCCAEAIPGRPYCQEHHLQSRPDPYPKPLDENYAVMLSRIG